MISTLYSLYHAWSTSSCFCSCVSKGRNIGKDSYIWGYPDSPADPGNTATRELGIEWVAYFIHKNGLPLLTECTNLRPLAMEKWMNKLIDGSTLRRISGLIPSIVLSFGAFQRTDGSLKAAVKEVLVKKEGSNPRNLWITHGWSTLAWLAIHRK